MAIDEVELLVEAGGDSLGALVVRLALSVKGLHFEQRMVSGRKLPSGVRLQRGNVTVNGVFAALEFLEDAYPTPPLLSSDPMLRARARRLVEAATPCFQTTFPMESRASSAVAPSPEKARLEEVLAMLERELDDCTPQEQPKTAFAVGDALSIGGLCVVATCFVAKAYGISIDCYPHVCRNFAGLYKLPALTRIGILHGRPVRLVDDLRPEHRDEVLSLMVDRVGPIASRLRLLQAIAWPREIEEKFFADGASRLPEPKYEFDRQTIESGIQELSDVLPKLEGDHVFLQYMRRMTQSFLDAHRLMLSVGTPTFYRQCRELYGGARTTAFDRDSTNYDLAMHIQSRVGDSAQLVDARELDTDAFVAYLTQRLEARHPPLPVDIVRDPNLSAKVICGRTRIRVREGAHFGRLEAEGMFRHEIETHALTAQNGVRHKLFPLLGGGGPRTTRTQEGLAVFSELMGRALPTPRLLRLAKRVELVAMAEDGASFLDLYRFLVAGGANERDAYLDVVRICRGGTVSGGAPFTKDACYLAGLLDVYDFMKRALRFKKPLLGDLLLCGRMALDDVLALLWMRTQGIIEKPAFLPAWAMEWDGLLAYFSFTSFLGEIETNMAPQLPDVVLEFIHRSVVEIEEREGHPVAAQ